MKKLMVLLLMMGGFGAGSQAQMTGSIPIAVSILSNSISSISVAPASMTWDASVHPDSYFRFNSGIFTCTFFAAYQPWYIRAYHTNGVGGGKAPLKSTGDDRWLSVRMWQPNFGVRSDFNYYGKPTNFYDLGYMPDPMLVWTTGVSRLINNVTTATNLGSSAEGDASPIRFNFVVMDTNRVEGIYSGTIYFELVTP